MATALASSCGSAFDFSNYCTREKWAAYLPLAVVLATVIKFGFDQSSYKKSLAKKTKRWSWIFSRYMTLEEALRVSQPYSKYEDAKSSRPWPVLILPVITLPLTLAWLGAATYKATVGEGYPGLFFIEAFTWLYATVRVVVWPSRTVMYDFFGLSIAHLIGAVFHVYSSVGEGSGSQAAAAFNLIFVFAFLVVQGFMPFAVPSQTLKSEDATAGPEDYTSLLGWITFMWTYPIMHTGRYNTLKEDDVPKLSPTIQARPLFEKWFPAWEKGTHLGIHIFKTNSLDFITDFVLTMLSVGCEYLGPFFLKSILDTIDTTTHPDGTQKTPDELTADRRRAYVYAFLLWLSTYLKAQFDINHLWYGRRALTRARSMIMTAIYNKALKRVSLASTQKDDKDKDGKQDTGPKKGADLGKVVNLMTADVNKIVMFLSMGFFFYSNPVQIVIAAVFLYKLLGWSAFAGFSVLLVGTPLNAWLSKRTISITKSINVARDSRMSVVTEVIQSIKFIKFFAWEEKWVDRALDKRAAEMKQIVRARINAVFYTLYWMATPVSISIISFTVFVATGHKLTISTAFTALQLFSMIRMPMNALPHLLVHSFTSWVSLQRIATYLDEDEVPSFVTDAAEEEELLEGGDDDALGFDHASFKWNETPEKKPEPPAKKWLTLPKIFQRQPSEASSPAVEPSTPVPELGAEEEDHKFQLTDLTVAFPEGKLSMIVGPTASGKTALLMALLGEMTLLEGRPTHLSGKTKPTFAYASQLPWLRHQSIKDNILFGYPLDEKRYQDVVEACALNPDFDMLEDGDATEIGSRGVSLSGGQKARVALARAVYSPAKYVLLDDPLSAVDSHTSRFLFEKLLSGPLLADRTVILVTHHVELVLPAATFLVRMLDGRIDTQGTVSELRARGLLDEIKEEEDIVAQEQEAVAEETAIAVPLEASGSDEDAEGDKTKSDSKKQARKLVQEEHREEGGVNLKIYNAYMKASGYWVWGIVFTGVILYEMCVVGEKLWINVWGSAYRVAEEEQPSLFLASSATHSGQTSMTYHTPSIFSKLTTWQRNWPDANEHPLYYVGIYAAIGLSGALLQTASALVQYYGAVRASKVLFKRLLVTVVRATFRFHDTTPTGRLLNRFGKDIETIDDQLADMIWDTNLGIAGFTASIIVVAAVFPIFLIPAVFIGFLYLQLTIGYLNTGRDLRRMEANTRSPIFSTFSELLDGIVTVRAFSKEKQFLDEFYGKVDLTTKMWYAFWMTNRFLLLNFDTLGATITLISALLAISYLQGGAGLAGVCITSAMSFSASVYWACRFYTELEMCLNSVERVVEYLELPQEPPPVVENNRPPAYWPSATKDEPLLTVEDLEIKYAPELPSVLQGVSFQLKAGERVGLLGRTGSGKSTLAMSLFRFVDPTSGKIRVDGIDISNIGVYDLRSRMTFIPQDATLFSGTIRDNLDPFGEHEDSECLDVLYRTHLLSNSTNTSQAQSRAPSEPSTPRPGSPASGTTATDAKTTISLTTAVSAGGTNFSQGQRQLIAMARALLRRSSIIVLDEATSSIDFATDTKIQQTIREEFDGALLITVAHRLRTIIDYDRLIVLDKGKIAEFDTPLALIEKEGSIFRNMCLKSGTFQELLEKAQESR
ncbi:hypothetical protein DL96DRAFT_1821685 [Flagelloscypha sp. PMI_526]|nr:hypothetical protein DL96DRAFT_1821685 [Flagelloscypha sp. PMI_526]